MAASIVTTSTLQLLLMVFIYLAVNVSVAKKGCKAKKACTVLEGTCMSINEECNGKEVEHKMFCKGKKCKCCLPSVVQPPPPTPPPCTTNPPPPPPTTAPKPPPAEFVNDKPIIGVLAQELTSGMKEVLPQYKSYIGASYVKFIESGGARVVPIMIDQNDTYYEKMVRSLNGIVWPGGGNKIDTSGYAKAGAKLYDLIVASGKAGNPVPLWATCLGFQMLMYLTANTANGATKHDILDRCQGVEETTLPLDLKEWKNSSLLGSAPDSVIHPLKTMDITSNFHKYCVFTKIFNKWKLNDDFLMVSTNNDTDGVEFISTVEHKTLPIWGAQWHIEKNQYEFIPDSGVPRFPEAIHLGHYIAQFFNDQARQNNNSFSSIEEARKYLIYNYNPIWLPNISKRFTIHQAYFFE